MSISSGHQKRTETVLLLAGPTASGKTAAALELAQSYGATIINADSMQVYRDLTIITARPSAQEMARAPHLLFGHVDGAHAYSTGTWLQDALAAIEACRAKGSLPLLVGGTGLYFRALVRGLAHVPPVDPAHVEDAKALIAEGGLALLMAQARQVDPEAAARLQGDDSQRAIRIVSVARSTGRRLSDWQRDTRPPLPQARFVSCVLEPERAVLYQRINARAEAMLSDEGVSEVEALLHRGLSPDLPVMRALGVPEIRAMLEGSAAREGALHQLQQNTRRYAKRQLTFLRNQLDDWTRATDQKTVIARLFP